ncbi:MAG: hypothetical protein ABIS47_03675 [Acidimicrobiales bacterium]
MERTIWMTEERTAASATGAPRTWRTGAKPFLGLQSRAYVGTMPNANGPGLVFGSATCLTNDHAAIGRTARHGTPLGSPGDGNG